MSASSAAVPSAINQEIFAALRKVFQDCGQADDLSLLEIARTMAARLSPASWRSYGSIFARFVRFCVERDLDFLPALPSTGLLWAQFLASGGSVQASTAQPYFSSVNTIHELLGFSKPCADNAPLASFRKGWLRLQVRVDSPVSRVLAFPAISALAVYNALPSFSGDWFKLRAALFVVLSFCLVLRPDSLLSVKQLSLFGDPPAVFLRYQPMRWKGQIMRADQTPVMQFPLAGLPLVVAALARFQGGPGSVWRAPSEDRDPGVANAEAWFHLVVNELLPSSMGDHTLYSLRRGGASAARAAGVPMEVLESFGGWCAGSSALRRHYLDFGVGRDAACLRFFEQFVVSGSAPFVGQFFNS